MLIQSVILSISLSLDAFGIGAAYQVKGVYISWKSKIVIGVMTMLMMYGAFSIGNMLLGVFDSEIMKIVGSSFLFLMGCIFIRNSIYGKGGANCDFDSSKTIDVKEAAVLAVVLSTDSLSAGCACVVSGMDSVYIPLLVGAMHILFIYLGQRLVISAGSRYTVGRKCAEILSGVILIIIALLGLY